MKLYGGMDLHSTNVVTQLINEEDKAAIWSKFCKTWSRLKTALKALRWNRLTTGIGWWMV